MLILTKAQIRALDIILLRIFLKKVEDFLVQQVPDEAGRVADLNAYVQEQYNAAKKAGHRTEREIAQYILDQLSNNAK